MTRPVPQQRERGFTLIELMVVIVILGGLIALVGPNVWNMLFQSRKGTAEAQMSNLKTAIDNFKMQEKRLPNSLEELTEPPEGSPYSYMEEIPMDPWGQEYEYKQLSKGKYELVCAGEDQEMGTDDDIKWPKPKN